MIACTPYYGNIEPETWVCMFKLEKEDVIKEWIRRRGQPTSKVRNMLVKDFLEKDSKYLLFVDGDAICNKILVGGLFKMNKPIVSPLTLLTEPPYPISALVKGTERKYDFILNPKPNSILEVEGVGMHCTLIKREVFEKVEHPWYEYKWHDDVNAYIGEDLYFCLKAKEKGYSSYIHTGICSPHIGIMKFAVAGVITGDEKDEGNMV